MTRRWDEGGGDGNEKRGEVGDWTGLNGKGWYVGGGGEGERRQTLSQKFLFLSQWKSRSQPRCYLQSFVKH